MNQCSGSIGSVCVWASRPGSASGAVRGTDPDPYQNVMDPQNWKVPVYTTLVKTVTRSLKSLHV
jgi:hypothetical protein